MKLWLARHAQPLIATGVCYGASDVPADEAATWQAAESLANALPANTLCRVSPLQRCQKLASALLQIRPDCFSNANFLTDVRLVEMDFGRFEGRPWASIAKDDVDAWTANFGQHRFGGQESANDVLQRVGQALKDCRAQQVDDVLWITHAGVIRAASLLAEGIARVDTADQWPKAVPAFGEWTRLDFDGQDD